MIILGFFLGDKCLVYNNQLSQLLDIFESQKYMTTFIEGIIKDDKIYIATNEKGVLIINNNNNDFSYLKPDGPLENILFSNETGIFLLKIIDLIIKVKNTLYISIKRSLL